MTAGRRETRLHGVAGGFLRFRLLQCADSTVCAHPAHHPWQCVMACGNARWRMPMQLQFALSPVTGSG